jgi:hypothetical protein
MAEVAATAIGIAGAVSVLQSLLQYATDLLSQQVLNLVENERQTGNMFKNVDVSDDGRLQFGNKFAKDWQVFFKSIGSESHVNVNGKARVIVGDIFGGKGFWD